MTASNRQTLINKTYKVLKKHYEPVAPPAERPVLEHLLYACCLESAKHDSVDDVLAKLEQDYFDWNEVRVTTVTELAEVMADLPDAIEAAKRLKRSLQGAFETHYSYDLEFLKKQNLGKAIKDVEKFSGATPFVVSYVTQNALGGHSIPVNSGVFAVLHVLGVISDAEAAKRRVPGLERAIPKSKGVEFASLLHQMGVDYATTPFSPRVRSILLEIAPEAKDRLPKRGAKKDAAEEQAGTKKRARASKRRETGTGKRKPRRPAAPQSNDASSETGGQSAKPKSTTKRLSRKKPR